MFINQGLFSLVIISFIPMIWMFNQAVVLWREIRRWLDLKA